MQVYVFFSVYNNFCEASWSMLSIHTSLAWSFVLEIYKIKHPRHIINICITLSIYLSCYPYFYFLIAPTYNIQLITPYIGPFCVSLYIIPQVYLSVYDAGSCNKITKKESKYTLRRYRYVQCLRCSPFRQICILHSMWSYKRSIRFKCGDFSVYALFLISIDQVLCIISIIFF